MSSSIQPYCQAVANRIRGIAGWLLIVVLTATSVAAPAETIAIRSAVVRLADDAYVLDAEFDLILTPPLEEALNKGTALWFVLETETTRSRSYWFDEQIKSPQSTRRLSFNAFTNSYRVDTGNVVSSPNNYATLNEALRQIRLIRGRTLFEKRELKSGERYEVSLRLKLDTAHLPKPLQVNTLVSKEWTLTSDWYRVLLTP